MCGLAGLLQPPGLADADGLRAAALRMADALRHRGPDDRGAWADPEAGVALGFRRLAIIDPSPEGHQPMQSAEGRYVLAFNGEAYNFGDLRRELGPSARFRGHSDTEVLLAAIERRGVDEAVRKVVGMFAFALWDRQERALTLGRDRLGEKPLYYGRIGDVVLFASELKALRAHPGFRAEVDREALALFLRDGYIPAPHSIYRGIHKLPPGTLLRLDGGRIGAEETPRAYWSAARVAEAGRAHPFVGTEAEAIDRLDGLLRDSVRRQMVADVPLGAFLSGGIDSSAVVAMMQGQGSRPARTFTVGFEEAEFDEAPYAREVARHLGTEHTELTVTPAEAMATIPDLPALFDEPFADSSGIPLLLVARLARRDVTVCLSGDGGDELFGGYAWYPRTALVWGRVRWMPRGLRKTAAGALDRLAPRWPAGPNPLIRRAGGDRVRKLARLLERAGSPGGVHRALLSRWDDAPPIVLGAAGAAVEEGREATGPLDALGAAMLLDQTTYLPDDVLTKVDRATMGVGLEARAPLLDHRIVEFAWSLPASMKVRDGRGKWLLRRVLHRYVPPALVERPKAGFSVPIGAWLRGPLRDWAEGLLGEGPLRRGGLLDPGPIRRRWAEHLDGRRDWSEPLWRVLMLQAWAEGPADQPGKGSR